jgi:hypothetical protein
VAANNLDPLLVPLLDRIQGQLNAVEQDVKTLDVQLDVDRKERGDLILSMAVRLTALETWRGEREKATNGLMGMSSRVVALEDWRKQAEAAKASAVSWGQWLVTTVIAASALIVSVLLVVRG